MFLKHKRMKKGLPVICFENQRNWLGLQKIRKGDHLQIEGFATLYKKKQWQIKLYWAVLLNQMLKNFSYAKVQNHKIVITENTENTEKK